VVSNIYTRTFPFSGKDHTVNTTKKIFVQDVSRALLKSSASLNCEYSRYKDGLIAITKDTVVRFVLTVFTSQR
jgi:hypothetical protein